MTSLRGVYGIFQEDDRIVVSKRDAGTSQLFRGMGDRFGKCDGAQTFPLTRLALVIAFSHIDIRRKIGAEQVFYLEYFYFTIYLTILAVSINSVAFAMGKRVRFIQYRDNLITKLLYWPFLLLFIFAISVNDLITLAKSERT